MVVLGSLMDTVLPVLISRGLDSAGRAGHAAGDRADRRRDPDLRAASRWIFNFLRQWHTAQAVGDVVLTLRQDAFDAVLDRDMSFYDEYPSGKIVSRVTSDTEDFATVVTLTLEPAESGAARRADRRAVLHRRRRLALITLTIAPVIVLVALGFRRIARASPRSVRSGRCATVNAQRPGDDERHRGRQDLPAGSQASTTSFARSTGKPIPVEPAHGLVFSGIFPVLITIAGVGTAIVVYFGGLSVLQRHASPATGTCSSRASTIFWFPLTSIASFWSQFQQGLAASERVFALIDAEPRVVQTDSAAGAALAGRDRVPRSRLPLQRPAARC